MLARGLAALAVVASLVGSARAQVATDEFGIERFRLAMDRAGVLDVEWAGVPGHLSWGAGVAIGFAHEPLVIYDREMNPVDALVEHRLTTSLSGSIALWNRLQLGLAVDVVGHQSGSDAPPTMESIPAGGLGDIRLIAKALLVGAGSYQLAFVPALTIPGGSAGGYLREAGVGFAPALAVSARSGRLRGAINVGYDLKPRVEAAGLVSDDEAFARIGLAFGLDGASDPATELRWSTSFAAPVADADRNQVAIEMLLGAEHRLGPAFGAFAAFGIGLDNGFGTPDWRALAGVRYELASSDRDGDQLEGNADRCPDEAEDKDGFADGDGCPDPDNDSDGVPDEADRCVGAPEDKDGFEDADGCADPDNDGDGIADAQDRCPLQAEDADGFQDTDGCADGKATVRGRIVDPDGRPIAGAFVSIVQLELAGSAPIELTSDADGAFTTTLDGGQVQLVARAKEYKETSIEATIAPGSNDALTVKVVRAIRQGQLRGQVLSFNGQPLAATITVKGKTTATSVTDADGHFTIELPEGSFAVEVTAAGYVTQKRTIGIKLDGVTVLNVDLRSTK
jgi:hypothetical protein